MELGAWSLALSPPPAAAESSWESFPGHRRRALAPAPPGTPGFTRLAAEQLGTGFTNRLAQERFLTNQIHLNGSGVALGDVDGDGRPDVFLAGLDTPNALLLNLGGWRFTNAAAAAGVALPGLDCTGAALADVDGDGDLDLLVNTVGQGTHILLNDGRGRFTSAPGSPFNPGRGGMSLALADVRGTGRLDVYVGNYRTDTFRDQPGTRFRGRNEGGRMVLHTVNGRPVTEPDLEGRYTIEPSGRIREHGEPDLLLRNEGGGRFTPEALAGGRFLDEAGFPLRAPPYDWTLAVLLRDLNGDGAPDLYVCNDFEDADLLWWNDGDGRFRPAPPEALRRTSMFTMAADVADVDGDGHDDLFTADMLPRTHARRQTRLGDTRPQLFPPGEGLDRPQFAFNQLHRGRGDGTFAEVAWQAGITASDWTWTAAFLDVDLDGWEDLLLATGHELDMMASDIGEETGRRRATGRLSPPEIQRLKLLFPRLDAPNVAFRNLGGGRFADAGAAWRFDHALVSHGLACADLDGDGDLDVVINNLNAPASFLRNDAPAPRLLVRLRGRPPNTRGVGAAIRMLGGPRPQSQQIVAGGRYLSSDDPARSFAAGTATNLVIEVRWRGGARSVVPDARPGFEYEIAEPETAPAAPAERPSPATLFRADPGMNHAHHENDFDDFARQPLLPHRLSRPGPGIVAVDLDADGWDDLAVGAGAGGAPGVFRNEGGRLLPWPVLRVPAAERDLTGLLAWPAADGAPGLLVALANWEDGATNGAAVEHWNLRTGARTPVLPASASSPGTLAAADFDGDGDLDVFVGGRAVAGRYPEGAASALLVNDGGRLKPDPAFAALTAGWRVTAAVWSDLDGDGFPELILACDWGPIRILRRRDGRFGEWNPRVLPGSLGAQFTSLGVLTGLWSGLAAVDLDGDGRPDLVAGNWGENSRWQLRGERPLRLYHADYDGDGTVETLEAVFVPELGDDAPLRTWRPVSAALPFVREVAASHAEFSRLNVPALLGERTALTRQVEAATLASLVLLNRADHFAAHALPAAAQAAPVFGIAVADFDGDGHEDVFLAQNFFGVHADAARVDAGRGLLMRGDGTGRLTPREDSGAAAYGEQRGLATADWDRDGRPDLAIGQNAAPVRLFRNAGDPPGLRVRLAGPPGNPAGVGAAVRLRRAAGGWGPVRHVTAGAGWLSQSSPVLVFAATPPVRELEVRWPGGRVTRTPVPAEAREVTVSAP